MKAVDIVVLLLTCVAVLVLSNTYSTGKERAAGAARFVANAFTSSADTSVTASQQISLCQWSVTVQREMCFKHQ